MKKRTIMNPHIISGLVILSQMDKPRKVSMLLVLGAQSKAIKLQNRLQQDSRRPRTSLPKLDFEEKFLIRHGNRTTPRNTSRAKKKMIKRFKIYIELQNSFCFIYYSPITILRHIRQNSYSCSKNSPGKVLQAHSMYPSQMRVSKAMRTIRGV